MQCRHPMKYIPFGGLRQCFNGIELSIEVRGFGNAWKNWIDFVEGCSRQDAKRLYNLFDQLAVLFRQRLEKHKSEPRATSFTISALSPDKDKELLRLLDYARAAQLLYIRRGPAKERGRRENYYVPNRMLWPVRGLDPHGQHARASIKAGHLRAALRGKPIPLDVDEDAEEQLDKQRGLFSGRN